MKKKIITSTALLLTAFLVIAATIKKSSSGAPASHTGAPGEETCATSGYHDDNKINSGTAKVDLTFGDNETEFLPGHTYPVKVKISDPNVTRFGFQILALESKNSAEQGTFQITDSIRTQIVKNAYKLQDRKYVTYTFNGTDAVKTGEGEWVVNWTAPKESKKPITFYVGAVSANDDMSDKGDKVYTKSFTINNKNL